MSSSENKISVLNLDVLETTATPALVEQSSAISYAENEIGPDKQVMLNFSVSLQDGQMIDSNFGQAPVSFVVGDSSLPEGFEKALFGLQNGVEAVLNLTPEQAFGPRNEDNVQRFPAYQFPPDMELTKGLMIDFADAAGNNQAGVIIDFDKQYVEVDFNHPLAGRDIVFTVHIHDVKNFRAD